MDTIFIGQCRCGGYGQCLDEMAEKGAGRCHIPIEEILEGTKSTVMDECDFEAKTAPEAHLQQVIRELRGQLAASQLEVQRLREALECILEYWNKDRNEDAMFDALNHIEDVAAEALALPSDISALREHEARIREEAHMAGQWNNGDGVDPSYSAAMAYAQQKREGK